MIAHAGLSPSEIVENARDLGSPPTVYRRLTEMIENPRASATDVASIVAQDTALSVRLLKVANSAFYSFGGGVETVSQAFAMVGAARVRDLALATSVSTLFRGVPPELIHQDDFWRHSLACGIGARLLAERRGERNVERLFVAGMLHDVGRLVLYVQVPQLAGEVLSRARAAGILLYQAERELLGFDHGEVGGALMTRWQMPATLVETVARHHRPDADTSHIADVATVHVADILANRCRLGSSGESLVPSASLRALAALSIDEGALPELGAAVEAEYARSVAAFGLD